MCIILVEREELSRWPNAFVRVGIKRQNCRRSSYLLQLPFPYNFRQLEIKRIMLLHVISVQFAGLSVLAWALPASSSSPSWGSYSYGGACPTGWNSEVENFCTTPAVLQCCDSVIGGVAGEPDATATGCKRIHIHLMSLADSDSIPGTTAMAGGQITYEFGFCPMNKAPLCCAVVVSFRNIGISKIFI